MTIITNYNRVIHTLGFKQFEKMYNELCPYLNDIEQDKCLDFMITIEDSKYDVFTIISKTLCDLTIFVVHLLPIWMQTIPCVL